MLFQSTRSKQSLKTQPLGSLWCVIPSGHLWVLKCKWAGWSPFLIRSLCFLMPTTWWPLVKRSHTTVLGVTDSPCGFQPWAEATCPREWRIPHWSCWERYPHLCISLVKTVSTLTWFRVLALPYPDYFAPECSTKCGHTGCLGQQEHARWQMSWQESTCCLKLEYTSLWQSLVSVPDSLWLQARSAGYFPGTLLSSSLNGTVFQLATRLPLRTATCPRSSCRSASLNITTHSPGLNEGWEVNCLLAKGR